VAGADPAPPVERGALDVADRAVERITRAAVLGAPGVAPTSRTGGGVGGGLAGALGRGLPRVDVARAGSQVDVEVELASVWPRSAAQVADAVRERVREELLSLAGLTAGSVSVSVVDVVRPTAESAPRRVR